MPHRARSRVPMVRGRARVPMVLTKGQTFAAGNVGFLRDWCRDRDVWIVADGGSRKDFDLERLTGQKTIAVNRALYAFEPTVCVFIDSEMSQEFRKRFPNFPAGMDCHFVAGHYGGVAPGGNVTVLFLRARCNVQTPVTLDSIHGPIFGRQSSTQIALSIAIIGGARRILLLGVDGGSHGGHASEHPTDAWDARTYQARYGRQIANCFDVFKPWADRVYNLNRRSNVKDFQFADAEEFL